MNLHARLLLGFGPFIVALLGLGAWSALRLGEMGDNSRLIIADNYESVIAAQQMMESLERQDSAVTYFLFSQGERGQKLLPEQRRRFDEAFDKAARNVTEKGEAEVVDSLRRRRGDYYRIVDEFLARRPGPGEPAGYLDRLEPPFDRLRADCERLLSLNQEAMLARSAAAEASAGRSMQLTVALAGGLVAAGLLLAFLLANRFVRPLRELTETSRRIAGGDLQARSTIASHDEIGILAAEFNRMAERLQQVRRTDIGRLLLAQQATEAAIDSLAEPVLITDAEGRVTKLNRAAAKVFESRMHKASNGNKVENLIGDNRIAMAVREALDSQRKVAIESFGASITVEVGGAEHAFRLQTNPMSDEAGNVLGAVVLLEDITTLKEVDRLKSDFIDTASAHLRGPLIDLQMGLHVLLAENAGEINDNQREILFNCRDDSERLEKVIRDLVDLSRLESGETSVAIEPVNAVLFFRDIAEKIGPMVEARGISFRTDLDQALIQIRMDPRQVERVIAELVDNAIRSTPRGGEIELKAAARDNYVSISVSDTGRGISSEYLTRIFNRFTRIPDSPPGRTGLGLAICRRLVEAHGGQISVRSEEGQGAVFTFTLPQSQG